VAAWPTSPRFTPAERACLALTEQFVMDANGVSEKQVAAVTEHLGGSGCYAFVQAISVLETFQRACLTMGIRSSPGLDEIMQRAALRQATTEVSQ
jgi:alkylhydroperoxidase family enzyme